MTTLQSSVGGVVVECEAGKRAMTGYCDACVTARFPDLASPAQADGWRPSAFEAFRLGYEAAEAKHKNKEPK